MTFERLLRGATLVALLLLTACLGGPPSQTRMSLGEGGDGQQATQLGVRMGEAGVLPRGAADAASELPAGSGAVLINVVWPERSLQYIPSKTLRFDLFARAQGSTTVVATTSIVFPNKSGTLKPIPQGTASVEAWAYDEDKGGKILATGSVDIAIKANDTVAGSLELFAAVPLSITSFSPANGIAGDILNVVVKGVVDKIATAKIGSIALATSSVSIDASGSGTLGFVVPATGSGGIVEITTDGGAMKATASLLFTRIASVNISPLAITTATGSAKTFAGVALTLDANGNPTSTVSNPVGLDFSVVNLTPYVAGQEPRKGSTLQSSSSTESLYTANATGSDNVLFGRGGVLTATAVVTVQ